MRGAWGPVQRWSERTGFWAWLALVLVGVPACAHAPRFDTKARRTCLVLSAGGTKGVAELGALAAVTEAHVPISCVVGTSVGALVGGLYASAPDQDTTLRFRHLVETYRRETEVEAVGRGVATGVFLAALAATLSGELAPTATAAVGGYLLGAATTSTADRARMERALRLELASARIESLPVPFATLHHERTGTGLSLVVDRSGDLAEAVGASIANPFVFDDVDVKSARAIDPGGDRVAATPVQEACRLFPDANLLVINISGAPAFYDAAMRCPIRETTIEVEAPAPEAFFTGGPAFDRAWRAGYDATRTALAGL